MRTAKLGPVFSYRCVGLTLVELLIALAISSLMMLAAVTMFLHSKVNYTQDEELARLQENGRYAMQYLERELAMAGFYGGVLRGSDIDIDSSVGVLDGTRCYDYMFRAEDKIHFINDVSEDGEFLDTDLPVGNSSNDCLDHRDLVPGTDVLLLRRVKDTATVIQGATAAGAKIGSGTAYVVVEGHDKSVRIARGLASVGGSVDLWEYLPQLLYIRKHGIVAGDGIPTLCRRYISRTGQAMSPAQCLVQGVEQLQLEFGIDTAGDFRVDSYVSAPQHSILKNALTARIYLLMRSPNGIVGHSSNKSFNLGSKQVATRGDNYFRRVFFSTVFLRNSDALGIR